MYKKVLRKVLDLTIAGMVVGCVYRIFESSIHLGGKIFWSSVIILIATIIVYCFIED
jgi:hypothetical protein